ncbi:endonuclease/exonuclease/phosphatase family protein [Roseibium sp. SCPC15]|uniref:endonuclease/exonuclease/phosphatase family protein n=1 Tax=Roseibium sp. SCP15 TaxID=3141376 RepID=UPI003334B08B
MSSSDTRSRRSLRITLFSFICWCGCLGALLAGVLGLSAFVAPDFWFADNMSFFLRQFLAGGLAGCIAGASGLWIRHRLPLFYKATFGLAVISLLALAGLTGARTLANTVPVVVSPDGARPIKIVSINIEHLFLGDKVLQKFLLREKPDIVVVQEVLWWLQERRWNRLEKDEDSLIQNGFPEHRIVGKLGGLVVFSRFPVLEDTSITISGEFPDGAHVYYDPDRELLSLTLDTGKKPLRLLSIHPDSPRSKARWLNKRRYMEEVDSALQDLRNENPGQILVIGDWNSAPWSWRFQQTLSENNLKTAYPGGWPQTTRFFFDYRLHWILGAPVDQFAVSDDVQVTSVSLGPDFGSDHLPLIVEINLPETPNN